MSSKRPFTAQFPRSPENGDEVFIRGKLYDNASSFSVNFCLPRPSQTPPGQTPPYIAYHFKTIFDGADDRSRVVHNWKNVRWQEEEIHENRWHTDRASKFSVIFRLHEDSVKVFVNCADHPPEYEFQLQLPLDQIEAVELWDDVESIEEISFRYDNRNSY